MRLAVRLWLPAAALFLPAGCSEAPIPKNKHLPPIAWTTAKDNASAPGLNHSAQSWSGAHKVKTRADVPLASAIQDDRAVVHLGEREIKIEFDRGRILLDDGTQAPLPSATKEVEIRYAGGKLSIAADGTDLRRATAAK